MRRSCVPESDSKRRLFRLSLVSDGFSCSEVNQSEALSGERSSRFDSSDVMTALAQTVHRLMQTPKRIAAKVAG